MVCLDIWVSDIHINRCVHKRTIIVRKSSPLKKIYSYMWMHWVIFLTKNFFVLAIFNCVFIFFGVFLQISPLGLNVSNDHAEFIVISLSNALVKYIKNCLGAKIAKKF